MKDRQMWDYVVSIVKLDDYWFAWIDDFGWCACSATGDTPKETIDNLEISFKYACQFCEETNRVIPEPVWPIGLKD